MYLFIGLITFIFQSSFAQIPIPSYSIKCTYSLSHQLDSTDSSSRNKEYMLLLIHDGESLFVAENKFRADSISDLNRKNNTNLYLKDTYTDFNYKILKNKEDMIHTIDKFNDWDLFAYSENRDVYNWQIQSDTATIQGFLCQKVITHFGGRDWIAWFSESIPINDGPYKFTGLPGLIVKVNDSQDYYTFLLESIQELEGSTYQDGKRAVSTTKANYLKAADHYRRNAFAIEQQRGKIIFVSGIEEMKKNVEENGRRRNNPIELLR